VVAPFVYKHWLNEYRDVEFIGSNRRVKFIRNENLLPKSTAKGVDLKKYVALYIYLKTLLTKST
jgi:hypothetical protein